MRWCEVAAKELGVPWTVNSNDTKFVAINNMVSAKETMPRVHPFLLYQQSELSQFFHTEAMESTSRNTFIQE